LIVFVPAFLFLWSKKDDDSYHFRRYTKNELNSRLQKAGFETEKIGFFNLLFFFPLLLVRFFQRTALGKNLDWGYGPKIKNRLINRLLVPIFTLDVYASTIFSWPFGVSLFAVASKKR